MENVPVRAYRKRNIDPVFVNLCQCEIAAVVENVVNCLSQRSKVIREAFIVNRGLKDSLTITAIPME
jgi:hypothetical protein